VATNQQAQGIAPLDSPATYPPLRAGPRRAAPVATPEKKSVIEEVFNIPSKVKKFIALIRRSGPLFSLQTIC